MAYAQVTEAFADGGSTRECNCVESPKECKCARSARCAVNCRQRKKVKLLQIRSIEERGIRISAHARGKVDLYRPMTLGHHNEAFQWDPQEVQGGGPGAYTSNH